MLAVVYADYFNPTHFKYVLVKAHVPWGSNIWIFASLLLVPVYH